MNTPTEVLFKLLRIALGNESDYSLPNFVDWREVIEMSYRQCVAAIAVDGLLKLYDEVPDIDLELDNPEFEDIKYEWLGFCVTTEQKYISHLDAITKLASFYKQHGIPMMLLKGYGLSLNYPVPIHRPVGDIDVYLWGIWNIADEKVKEKLGIYVDNSHHHHSEFWFEGYLVEDHYDFVNVNSHFSNKKIESLFKQMADDKNKAVKHKLDGNIIYLPPTDFNVLFIIRHCACHFASEEMTLRQLLDWSLFVDKHHQEVDWCMFWNEAEKMGMTKFVLCIDDIAVKQLGFDGAIFHTPHKFEKFPVREHDLVNRVFCDILHPEYDEKSENGTANYVWSRLKRWWHNRWKHKIVYSDSLISTFFVQIISHLMKPATIKGF